MDYYLSREGGTTHNSRQQILLLLCLVWSWSQQGQSEMFTQAPTLGTHRERPLAGLQQERVAKFKALTSTKMGLRPKNEFFTLGKFRLSRGETAQLSPQKQKRQIHLAN